MKKFTSMPVLEIVGHQHYFDQAQTWLENWGFRVVFLAGLSPIPFKVFTVTAVVVAATAYLLVP